jgi:hypothetical protein
MGIGDSIEKAAKNAMEDLAGTSRPTDDAHAPEPGAPDEDISVHSSISEGSNALDGTDEAPRRSNSSTQPAPADKVEDTDPRNSDDVAAAAADSEVRDVLRDVPGPAGLPAPDPEALRADPTEGDADATTGMGRS